jgi:deoxycytidylate deaminase
MLTETEKSVFAGLTLGNKELSGCPIKQGAVLVQNHRILSHGYNRRIIKDKEWEVSAIYDTLFGARNLDLTGSSIFSTYFPSLDELKLIIAAGIISLYFFGEVQNIESVKLLNALPEASIPLEIVRLQNS